MKRVFLMTLAVLATLVVASCSKENEPDTNYPLEGEWELYMFKSKNPATGNYGWWATSRRCVTGIYATFTDRTFTYYNVYATDDGKCINRYEYWDYTKVGNELRLTKSANATWQGQANLSKATYEIKNGELFFRFEVSNAITFLFRRRNADYSHLDPFVGAWLTTRVVINGKEYVTRENECLRGIFRVTQDEFTLSLRNEKCQQEDLTRPWVKRGGRYYSVNPNGDKELEIEFLNGNRELKLSVPEAKAVFYFEKERR